MLLAYPAHHHRNLLSEGSFSAAYVYGPKNASGSRWVK
jgi:hypothetical protein